MMLNKDYLWKEESLVSVSFFNFLFSSFLLDCKIDFFRCDLDEVALINGMKDSRNVTVDDILSIVKNYRGTIPLSVDLPLSVLFEGRNFSLSKMIDFYLSTHADFLSIDLKYFDYETFQSLIRKNIPLIGYSSNRGIEDNFSEIKELSIEFQSAGGSLLIFNDYPDDFVMAIRNNITIPVLSNTGNKCRGVYRKISDLLGLSGRADKMFHLKDVFLETLDEYILEHRKK